MYVRAKANVIIVLWRQIQGENLIFFVLVFFALLHVLLVINDLFYVMCIYSYDAYHQLQVPLFQKATAANKCKFLFIFMCNCLLSHFDFFIPLWGVYYSFSDLSYTHTQQLSFANSDLFNCSYSLNYKRNWHRSWQR